MVLILISTTCGAQAQEAAKLLRKELIIDVKVNSRGEMDIDVEEITVKKIIDPSRVRDFITEEVIYFEEEFETAPSVDAYTSVPKKNGKMKKVKVTSISEEDHLARGIFYSGTKKKIVNFPNITEGSELYCSFEYKVLDPHLLPSFFFNDYLSCDESILRVKADASVDMGFLEFFRGYDKSIEFTETKDGETTIFEWKGSNFEPRKYEDDAGGNSCNNPHLIPHVKTFETNDNSKVPVLRNKEDLFAWYNTLVQDFELSAEYKSILAELKKGANDDHELAQRIFNWVQTNVKYIAYEDGIEGFQPRNPNDVIKNRFGDCKDMAVLVATMMNACEIDCYFAWVGTRSKCYTYDDCPTPMVDNHMIAAYPKDDQLLFLDATNPFSEFGVPTGFVQGKEAMVRVAKEDFRIVQIPVQDASYSSDMDAIKIVIDEKGVLGEGTNFLTGYMKEAYQAGLAFSDLAPEKLFINFHDLGNKSLSVGDLTQENTDVNGGKLKSTYKFKVDNYVDNYENAYYINPFIKSVIDFDVSERTQPLQFDEKFERGAIVTLLLDDGYKVTSLVESTSIKENGFELNIEVTRDEESVTVAYTFYCHRLEMLPEEFEDVKETLNKMKKLLKQSIELNYED
ncbi:MAG: hypothetical protein Crog4KO_06220 [Crocinitomicaceae bacterium]